MSEEQKEKTFIRLSDRVLEALKLSLEQKDIAISELLTRALEMTMTRGAGGRAFIERREFSEEVKTVLAAFDQIKREAKGL